MINTIIWSVIIFFAMTIQVLFGTVRLILMVRGKRTLTLIIAFFESILSLTIAIKVISDTVERGMNYIHILAYGGGFVLGLLIGMIVSETISKDFVNVNIISRNFSEEIEKILRVAGFGLTCYQGNGKDGEIRVLNIICKKYDFNMLQKLVREIDGGVFITSQTLKFIYGGFPFDLKVRR
ncbi:MAG: DUF5698 domain-containing protein [Candidatus Humimicrobiaceae bacterium]